jgi:C4-type Zn-finger protein
MQCPACKTTAGFSASEYRIPYQSGPVRAPALECLECSAIVLDEIAAHTDKELESVRQARVVRPAVIRQTDHRHTSLQRRLLHPRSDGVARGPESAPESPA